MSRPRKQQTQVETAPVTPLTSGPADMPANGNGHSAEDAAAYQQFSSMLAPPTDLDSAQKKGREPLSPDRRREGQLRVSKKAQEDRAAALAALGDEQEPEAEQAAEEETAELGGETATEAQVSAEQAKSARQLRIDRALLIASDKFDPDIVDEMDPKAVAAIAASWRERDGAKKNTAAPVGDGDARDQVEGPAKAPKEPAKPILSKVVTKAIAEHLDPDTAAAVGRDLEETLKPLNDQIASLIEQNKQLVEAVTQVQGAYGHSTVDFARTSLGDRFPELLDDGVFEEVRDTMRGLYGTAAFSGKPLTKELAAQLMERAARSMDLRQETAETRAVVTNKRAAKRNGQPAAPGLAGPTGRMTVRESDEQEYRGFQQAMKGRKADAHAIWEGIQ